MRGEPRIILASASPRRRELLETAGFEVEVRPAAVDETPLAGESPQALVLRLARAKAETVAAHAGAGDIVLGADTEVALGRRALGKPRDDEDARAMLRQLSGRSHRVLTGVALRRGEVARHFSLGRSRWSLEGGLRWPAGEARSARGLSKLPPREVAWVETTRVWFAALTEDDIAAYVATGEPRDKAGAYAIQGRASRFIPRIVGSYTNVVGLPVASVWRLWRDLAAEAGQIGQARS